MQQYNDTELTLSIVVPVYNVEKYFKQCIQSICSIDWLRIKYEVILVDDGSTDYSGKMCDRFAKEYYNITVLHQEHAGAAAARNEGIRRARGAYILFIDADDYIAHNPLKQLREEIRDCADIYFLQIQKIYPNGKKKLLEKIDNFYLKDQEKSYCIKYLSSLSKFPGSACAKLVRREVILEHHIFFEEGKTAEDLIWTLKCILYAKTYRSINMPFYYYRQIREGSVTFKTGIQSIECLQSAIQQGVALADMQDFYKYKKEIYCMMAYETEVLILLFGSLDKPLRMNCIKIIESVCWLLTYSKRKKALGIRMLIRFAGIRRGSWLLYKIWMFRDKML